MAKDKNSKKTEATVRDFKNFCFCMPPRLDKNDVCRKCGTQWS